MKIVKKTEKTNYSYTVRNPSPLARKQKALSFIKTKTDNEKRVTIKQVANHIQTSYTEGHNAIKELANAGYIQIGKARKNTVFGGTHKGSNPLSITPGKDVTRFLDISESEEAQPSDK